MYEHAGLAKDLHELYTTLPMDHVNNDMKFGCEFIVLQSEKYE